MRIKMYGAPICGDCVAAKEVLLNMDSVELEYIDITASTANMKEFLKLRDTESMYDEIKEQGKIGIPVFILEDGTKTLDLESYTGIKIEVESTPVNACSLDGKGNC